MNKDLDERLVPNGQYRDAMKIQITNSEDGQQNENTYVGTSSVDTNSFQSSYPNQAISTGIGNVGTAQNLLGNQLGLKAIGSTIQGTYNDPDNDGIFVQGSDSYFLLDLNNTSFESSTIGSPDGLDINIPRVIASVADETNNCAYFFISSPIPELEDVSGPIAQSIKTKGKELVYCDRIVKLT